MAIEKKQYRLTLLNADTHARIHSLTFTASQAIGILALSLCTILGLVYAILAFTPLHDTIPGYPDADFRRRAVMNARRIDSLETAMKRWQLYSENLNRALSGEETLDLDSVINGNRATYLQRKDQAYLLRQDSILRAKVASEEQYGLSGTQRNLPIEGMHFFTPLKGVISNGFDIATHPAVDITGPRNSVVKAVLDGTVIFSGWSEEYGYTITIQHASDIISSYKHNSRLLKKTGDKVSAGTAIANLGNTGSLSHGDHLHFELWYKGEAVNPAIYISF